jgi:galactonate dehydratase
MKITAISTQQYRWPRAKPITNGLHTYTHVDFAAVRIETDDVISGIGEAGAWGQLEASATAISRYAEYLVGKDPRQIEHHWNVMLRANHFIGVAISGAVSAIDIALWDIKGKYHNVPVYQLLCGKMRHTARIYGHVKGRTFESLAAEAKRLRRTASRHSAT